MASIQGNSPEGSLSALIAISCHVTPSSPAGGTRASGNDRRIIDQTRQMIGIGQSGKGTVPGSTPG